MRGSVTVKAILFPTRGDSYQTVPFYPCHPSGSDEIEVKRLLGCEKVHRLPIRNGFVLWLQADVKHELTTLNQILSFHKVYGRALLTRVTKHGKRKGKVGYDVLRSDAEKMFFTKTSKTRGFVFSRN